MTFFSKLAAATLTGLATIGLASTSFASTTTHGIVEGSLQAHDLLVQAIQHNGVKFIVNDPYCDKNKGVMGFYSGHQRTLVVCQDNAVKGGPNVAWTLNDLDTLRHEAQHMIQDCIAGTNHDHQLAPVYNSPTALAQRELGPEAISRITRVYRSKGASDLVLLLEYEAFSVASMNVPAEQVKDIEKYCK